MESRRLRPLEQVVRRRVVDLPIDQAPQGAALPAAVPESLVVVALGALATIFVLVRAISIPDEFFFAGRGIGLWISLLASVALIGAGLLQASEEL